MKRLTLHNIGQIKEADLHLGDLTVLVGPSSINKSISLHWLKLIADIGLIQRHMKDDCLEYGGDLLRFLKAYFGEGMQSIWCGGSSVRVDGREWNTKQRIGHLQPKRPESVFFIPAQRAIALIGGWPLPFGGYNDSDPYTLRAFSEDLSLLLESSSIGTNPLCSGEDQSIGDYCGLFQQATLNGSNLSINRLYSKNRLVLRSEGYYIPYTVWSAGQRELISLLLGIHRVFSLLNNTQRGGTKWVVIEDLELGLHPCSVSVVLLLVLDLMSRGYKVCLSTHSIQVLEFVWVMETLRRHQGNADDLLGLLDASHVPGLHKIAESAISKTSKVYYFGLDGTVKDITNLDPSSSDIHEASWGGLLGFSERANDVVAKTIANLPEFHHLGSH